MAEAVISVVVERAATILEEQIRKEVNLVGGAEEEVRRLSEKLKTIKNVLNDAEKRGIKEESVRHWLRKLEDTTYKMEDILDEWKYGLLNQKMEKVCCSFIPPSYSFQNLCFRRKIGMDIQDVRAKVDEIVKEKVEFGLMVMPSTQSDVASNPPRVQSTSSIELEKVCGYDIDRNKNDIVRKLMLDNGGSLLVMCIVGMGGLGKTTLAQLVYNDSRVKDCFTSRAWICVSDPFNAGEIARGIVESVTGEIIPRDTNRSEFLLEKLRNSISGKKFFLVLDDVWTEKYQEWECLKNSLKDSAQGSKILVTTRNENVAKMMMRENVDVEIYRPEKLSDKECWRLLSSISFSGRSKEECRMFEDVGKQIASKCEGLPLAANVLGSLLQFKNSLEEWENVLESEIWQLKEAELELFPHLILSYNELPPTLKQCFSYCAVYPKDYRINVGSLIEEWRALGYLGTVAGKGGAEVKGRDYFNKLATHSLFQDFEQNDELSSKEIEWCKMHDIVHDFAQFLRKNNGSEGTPEMKTKNCKIHDPLIVSRVQEYRSLYWDKATPPNLCDCVKSLRVLRFKGELDNPPKGIEKLIHLRWLDLSGTKLSQEEHQMICKLYFLQTLKLESCSIEEIPGEIGNLVNLRHLDLSNNKGLEKLPESMCSLVELQILNIRCCQKLTLLPKWIDKLKNLQCLLIDDDASISHHLPHEVGQLRDLCKLTRAFHAGGSYNKLELLKNLNRLAGSLELHMHFESSSDLQKLAEDAREAELRNKAHIKSLKLRFINESDGKEGSSSSLSSLWMGVIEALEPHKNLQKLEIMSYEGSGLPGWISSPRNSLRELHLVDLNELPTLPPLGKLRSLESLFVKKLMKMKFLGREFLGLESSSSSTSDGTVDAFPRLQKLAFNHLPKWEEWEDITPEEYAAGVSIMPCLMSLSTIWCKGQKETPRFLREKMSSLCYVFVPPQHLDTTSYGDMYGPPPLSPRLETSSY